MIASIPNETYESRVKRLLRGRSNYLANKSNYIARSKQWRVENKEKSKSNRRERYKEDHERRLEKGREYAKARKISGKAAQYREKIREKQREWSKNRSKEVTDGYAREMLAKNSPVSSRDFPPELVELKKIEIKLKRKLNTK